ncbi:MAG TPA: MscL family protein [Candidatus Saccharimonadales bacterium]|nr:MscL family protein [Candidatus Saccharimonadales bacterium]
MTEKKTTTKAKAAMSKTAKKPVTEAQVAKQKGAQTATRHLARVKNAKAAVTKRVPRPKVVMGFADFLREQSVVGLAIGLVIGTQVKSLADSLIASFINPLIGLLLPGKGALDQKTFILHLDQKTAVFTWGSFVATMLSFLTTAAVVYFVFKSLKLDRLTKKKDDPKSDNKTKPTAKK